MQHVDTSARKATINAVGKDILAVLPEDKRPWIFKWHLVRLNLIILTPLLSQAAAGFDGTMMNGLQTLPQWQSYFNTPSAPLLGALNAMNPLGNIVCFAPVAWVSDRCGRRLTICLGLLLIYLGAGLQGASKNITMFLIARFILGMATAFITQPSPMLVAELAYPTHRAKITAMYNTFYYLGSVVAAWATYATFTRDSTWSWRIPSIVQAAIPTVQLIVFPFVPESPRWLIANGKSEKARQILIKHHGNGDQNSPLVDWEMAEIAETIRLEKEAAQHSKWRDMFATKANRWRSAISVFQGFATQNTGVGPIFYYLFIVLNGVGITSTKDQTLINGGLSIWSWLVAILGALLIDRVGRRPMYLGSCVGMFFAYLIWTVLSAQYSKTPTSGIGGGVITMVFVFYFFYTVSWIPFFQAYCVEIWPYIHRSNGLALQYISAYCWLIFNLFVNPIALQNIGWKYYIVFTVLIACVGVVTYFLFPETKGHTLEEIAVVFEGENAHVGRVAVAYDEKDAEVHVVKAAVETELVEDVKV